MTAREVRIRAAKADDAPSLFGLIEDLAEYEGLSDQVVGSAEELADQLLGSAPTAEAVLAELESELAGFAIFFSTFSTFLCRPGLWIEDLFVRAEHRGVGVGGALLAYLARLALERGCARLEWSALDWNEPALRFYDGLGARRMDEWQMLRLEGEALHRLVIGSGPERRP